MTSYSHHTDRATRTGGAVAWLLNLQSKMLEGAYLLLPRDCHNITLYYQYFSKQHGLEKWFLWGENALIGDI